jgi:hypothetical protein
MELVRVLLPKAQVFLNKENMLIVKMVKMLKTKAFLRFIKVFISW